MSDVVKGPWIEIREQFLREKAPDIVDSLRKAYDRGFSSGILCERERSMEDKSAPEQRELFGFAEAVSRLHDRKRVSRETFQPGSYVHLERTLGPIGCHPKMIFKVGDTGRAWTPEVFDVEANDWFEVE